MRLNCIEWFEEALFGLDACIIEIAKRDQRSSVIGMASITSRVASC